MSEPTYATPQDALAATDEFYAAQGFAYSDDLVTSWLRAHVDVPSAGRVLDLCCGDGVWSRGFQLLNPRLELFGIDISAGGVAKARSLVGADGEHFVVGDAEAGRLPWPDGTFDVVFARGPGLYNQHDMDRDATIAVLEAWHRALSSRGRFYSIFASTPQLMGTYTPMEAVRLPYNRAPRRTDAVDFRGGKYHHTITSFCAPFWKAPSIEVVRYSFVGNQHILVTRHDPTPRAA